MWAIDTAYKFQGPINCQEVNLYVYEALHGLGQDTEQQYLIVDCCRNEKAAELEEGRGGGKKLTE